MGALLVLLAGCGGSASTAPPPVAAPGYAQPQAAPPPAGYAQPQAAPPPAGYVQPQGTWFVLRNHSSVPICRVYFSPSTDQQWGPDRLGERETIPPGRERAWSVAPGTYDFMLKDCAGRELVKRARVAFPLVFDFRAPESGAAAAPSGARSKFVIVNESSVPLCIVQISPSSDQQWGPDRLGERETIPPGARRAWEAEPGIYDVLIRDCRGRVLLERRNVPISGEGVALRVH